MVCPPTVTLPVLVLDSDLKGSNFPATLAVSESLSEELAGAEDSARTSSDRNVKATAATNVPYRIAFARDLICAHPFAFDRPIAVHRLIEISLLGAAIISGRGYFWGVGLKGYKNSGFPHQPVNRPD